MTTVDAEMESHLSTIPTSNLMEEEFQLDVAKPGSLRPRKENSIRTHRPDLRFTTERKQ